MARISADKWSIGIRGFGSGLNRDVLALIDGRSVYTSRIAGTHWEVQDTVIEGTASAGVFDGQRAAGVDSRALREIVGGRRKSVQPYHLEFPSDPGPNVAIKRSVYGKLVWRSKEN